jgi:arsenical resistance protein ArsH
LKSAPTKRASRPTSQSASTRTGEKLVARSDSPSITKPNAAGANPEGAPPRSAAGAEPVLDATGTAVSDFDGNLPHVDGGAFALPTAARLAGVGTSTHAPRFLMLYGSLRERSYSKLLTLEAARLLRAMGGDVRVFDPAGLPLPDAAPESHPKVVELREAAAWAEGMVWTSPERHGAMSGIMKAQIDWIPLTMGAVRPTQGKTLAVMQVSGGSQSFNAVNQLRVLGRWMRMITIPNQSSVAKAFLEFDEAGRMKPSAYYERVVDVTEELVKFTLLTRDVAAYL